MRIVATSDTHYPPFIERRDQMLRTVYEPTVPIPDGDVFIHAGDLCRTGYPDDWQRQLEWLARLPHKIKLFVPGNHDFHLQLYPGPALQEMRSIGVSVVGLPGNINFASVVLPNGMSLLGLPFMINLDRWAFNVSYETLTKYLESVWNPAHPHGIIVSHAPVLGKGMLPIYLEYLEKYKPKLWFSGHIHEEYGHSQIVHGEELFDDNFKVTDIFNVSMCNRDYQHANPPVVIDL